MLGVLVLPGMMMHPVLPLLFGAVAITLGLLARRENDAGQAHPDSRGMASGGSLLGLVGNLLPWIMPLADWLAMVIYS